MKYCKILFWILGPQNVELCRDFCFFIQNCWNHPILCQYINPTDKVNSFISHIAIVIKCPNNVSWLLLCLNITNPRYTMLIGWLLVLYKMWAEHCNLAISLCIDCSLVLWCPGRIIDIKLIVNNNDCIEQMIHFSLCVKYF